MATDKPAPRFVAAATVSDHFSWLRTRMSAERTLMSWARTSVSLIGFGFTIVQFFERLKTMEGVEAARNPEAARYLGLTLIATGTGALVVAAWEYHAVVRYLWTEDFSAIAGVRDGRAHTPALGVAIILILIGVLTFGSIAIRLI